MKKLLVIAGATLCCVGAFAQGSLTFALNSDNLIYFTTANATGPTFAESGILPGDLGKTFDVNNVDFGGPYAIKGALAATGAGINGGTGSIQAIGNPSFVAALYGGTSSTSLSLQTTTTIDSWANGGAGNVVAVTANMAQPFAAGTPAWFQIQVYDASVTSAQAAWDAGNKYAGTSVIFQSTPLSVPDFVYSQSAPVNSTWAPGTFNPTDLATITGGPGSGFGGIALSATVVPEPGTFALAGLGLAALLVFRRRS
jgi:hypothetical protein